MKKRSFAFGARYLLGFAVALLAVLVFATQDDGPRFSAWSEPVNLGSPANGPLADFFHFISKDGLSLYFTTNSNNYGGYGGYDIYVCQRASVNDPWQAPQNLGPGINTEFDEEAPSISPDGHLMYFASNRPGGFGGQDIYVARRHNQRDDFGWRSAQNLGSGVNSSANEDNPQIFEDDENTGDIILYFDSDRYAGPLYGPYDDDGLNGNDIYASILQPDETFGQATLVEGLNTTARERHVSIRRDGLEIFFVSNRTPGSGQLDLWVSTRSTTSDPWSAPVNLGASVNSPKRDGGPTLSWDGTTLYFCSDRLGSWGGYLDGYVITRTKLKGPDNDE